MRQGTRYRRRSTGLHPGAFTMGSCRRMALALGLAAALVVSLARGGITSQGAVFVYDDRESSGGPGAATAETDSTVLTGPYVEQVTLQERYHEEYKVYEESMADLFFFYASVGNGGITHEAVTLDIPQNISYTMEMDGLPYAYQSGQPVGAYGTYVVRLTGIEDETVPFYEQKEYRAVFRFRIQAKPPEGAAMTGPPWRRAAARCQAGRPAVMGRGFLRAGARQRAARPAAWAVTVRQVTGRRQAARTERP